MCEKLFHKYLIIKMIECDCSVELRLKGSIELNIVVVNRAMESDAQ